MRDPYFTGEVNGIKRTKNIRWPRELAKFGLEGFTAYDTEHGFTTVILPTGYGVIVRVNCPEAGGCYEKCTPSLLAYCMFSHASRKILKDGEPLLCLSGEYRYGGWVAIDCMNTEQRRLILEKSYKTAPSPTGFMFSSKYDIMIEEVDGVYPVWVAEHINRRPELLDGFKF